MDERKTTVNHGPNGPDLYAGTHTTSHVYGGSSDDIKRDIDRTRYEMDETLDELSERLQPRHLLDDLIDMFRSNTGGAGEAKAIAQRTGRSFMHQVQENPVPLALIGAGIAWMMISGRRDDREYYATYRGEPLPYPDDPRYDLYEAGIEYSYETSGPAVYPEGEPGYYASTSMIYGEGESSGEGRMSAAGEKMKGAAGDVKHRAGEAKDSAAERARAAGASVKGAAASARHSASSAAHTAAERSRRAASRARHGVGRAASSARHGVRRAGDAVSGAASSTAEGARSAAHLARIRAEQMGRRARYRGRVMGNQMRRGAEEMQHKMYRGYRYSREEVEHGVEEHPLGMGVGVFALGILAGLALPQTRREDELMGEWSDEMKHRAAESGQTLMRRGMDTARHTAHAAREELEREGLTPSALTEKFSRVILDSEEAARDAAQREGLTVTQLREKAQHVVDEAARTAKHEGKEDKEAAKSDANRQKEEVKAQASKTTS